MRDLYHQRSPHFQGFVKHLMALKTLKAPGARGASDYDVLSQSYTPKEPGHRGRGGRLPNKALLGP